MNLSRRFLMSGLAVATIVASSAAAFAFSSKAPFEAKAFDAAVAAGKPVLVEVSAPWCPTCKLQKPILSKLSAKKEFANFAVFEVDFDSQKDALKKLNVQKQSTLIVYKKKAEAARSVGDTDINSIEMLLQAGN